MWNRITKQKATIKFKPSSQICFQNVYHDHQVKANKTLNMNKERSGRRITTKNSKILKRYGKHPKKMQQNIEAVRQASEKNEGRISARRNGLGISPSSFCRIIKDLRWYPYRMIRRLDLKRCWLWETLPFC